MLFDNVNLLLNSCDTSTPELDLLEFLSQVHSFSEADPGVSVALSFNRDLFDEEDEGGKGQAAHYREWKHAPGKFDLVFECSRN